MPRTQFFLQLCHVFISAFNMITVTVLPNSKLSAGYPWLSTKNSGKRCFLRGGLGEQRKKEPPNASDLELPIKHGRH